MLDNSKTTFVTVNRDYYRIRSVLICNSKTTFVTVNLRLLLQVKENN